MVIEKGEKVHIIVRRSFETDVSRHFVGTIVSEGQGPLFRIQGYTFVLDAVLN